jgi:hypothetical protein
MRTGLIVLILACLPSCSGRHDPLAPAPGSAGKPVLVTQVAVEPRAFRPGETATITVSVTNRGAGGTVCFSNGCVVADQVRDRRGEVVAPLGFVCTQHAPCFDMAAGEIWTATFRWQGDRYDVATGAFVRLPPGTYEVYGGLDAMSFSRPSTPVRVELLPL